MKRIFLLLAIAMLALLSVACANDTTSNTTKQAPQIAAKTTYTNSLAGKKILVAYFSATNNTKRVAEEIAKATFTASKQRKAIPPTLMMIKTSSKRKLTKTCVQKLKLRCLPARWQNMMLSSSVHQSGGTSLPWLSARFLKVMI